MFTRYTLTTRYKFTRLHVYMLSHKQFGFSKGLFRFRSLYVNKTHQHNLQESYPSHYS